MVSEEKKWVIALTDGKIKDCKKGGMLKSRQGLNIQVNYFSVGYQT
jgi:hypothetical protein